MNKFTLEFTEEELSQFDPEVQEAITRMQRQQADALRNKKNPYMGLPLKVMKVVTAEDQRKLAETQYTKDGRFVMPPSVPLPKKQA